jgi:hypothetical protein
MLSYLILGKEYLSFFLFRLFAILISKFWKSGNPVVIDVNPPVNPEKEYQEKQIAKFLKSYDVSGVDFSSNIEPVFYDSDKLAATLSEENNVLETAWKTRVLWEFTPRGNVLMYYDPFRSAFVYHSDQTAIPYALINAVAMKYVMVYRCRDFFIDEYVVPSEHVSRLTPKPEPAPANKPVSASANSVFISPKLYHTTTVKTNLPKQVEKKMNKFVHLGKMVNFQVLQIPKKVNGNNGFSSTLLPSNVLSYEEYKRMQQNKETIPVRAPTINV